MKLAPALLLGIGLTGVSGLAQQPQSVPASYIIGPNDVLALSVFGDPELNTPAMRVDSDGTVHIPFAPQSVHVAGLTPVAAGAAVAAALVQANLAVEPKVELSVADAESHPILITGLAIKQPGTIQAVQPMRLMDALNRAGGLSDNTGDQIILISPSAHGAPREQRFTVSQVMYSTGDADNPLLTGGEEIRVMPGGNAYLSGAVLTPGAYALSDTDPLTVRKLLAKAHGLGPAAKAVDTQLIHHAGDPNQTMSRIDLPAILNGSAPDITLAANDMVYVPVSGGKKAGLDALSRTLSVLTIAAGELLVR